MKRKNFKMSLASLLVFLLVGVMCAGTAITSFTNNTVSIIGSTNSAISVGADIDIKLKDVLDPDKIEATGKAYSDNDDVSLIITMDDTSLVDIWLANPQGYTKFSDYRKSLAGRNAAENLIRKQNALYNKIARSANVTLKYNYVNVMNGFAIGIKYGDRKAIDNIAYKANIKSTVLATHYDAPMVDAVENEVTAYDTGIFDSEKSIYEKGIAGQGTVAAVLDTGLDWEHIAFSPNHPLFNLEEQKEEGTLTYKEEDIQELLDMPNGLLTTVRTRTTDEEEDPVYTAKATAKDLYRNEKVVFGFDYADKDTEISSDVENSHGTHVAGIIAGHSDTPYKDKDGKYYLKGKDDQTYAEAYGSYAGKFYTYDKTNGELTIVNNVVEVEDLNSAEAKNLIAQDKIPVVKIYDNKTKKQITGITGVAPQAQLAIFKVFSDFESGAHSDSLYAALEDAITLGVDSINMSLGSDSGFQDDSGAMDSVFEVYDKVGKSGISLVVAASNSYSSGFNSHEGLNLISNPDSATVGSPSTYDSAISVASISGIKTKYLSATNGLERGSAGFEEYGVAYYQDAAHVNGEAYDFMEDLFTAVKAKGLTQYVKKAADGHEYLEIPYVTILGTGDKPNYAGKDVTNKIALVRRGISSFEDKVTQAQAAGALACIIYNNVSGIIRMQVGDNIKHDEIGEDGEKINFPACSITMDDAAPIRSKDVTATGGIVPKFIFDPKAEAGPFMSEFSSWGPLPNLLLKPEITAHGGDIYSSIPGDETSYARMSGTSMACPNMAGVVTLMRSYMKQNGNPEKFDLWAYEYATNEDGTVKLDKSGNRVYKLENGEKTQLKDDDGNPYIDANVLEQRIYQILMSTTTIAYDEQGNPYSPRRQGSGLADLNRSETTEQYLVVKDDEGNETERTKLELLDDPQKTGKYTMKFYVRNVGTNEASYTISADVLTEGKSSNGKTVNEKARRLDYSATLKVGGSTHDLNTPIKVAGKSEVEIIYEVTLADDAKTYLNTFPNGMYVEGFVKLTNTDTKEDAIDLNVPYLAFYGNWADAPIFDYDIFETSADLNDDDIDIDYKRYSNTREIQVIGKLEEDGNEYALGLGQYAFALPEGTDAPEVEEDKCSLSYNEDSALFNIYCVAGFLRGVKKLFYQITDVATGEIIREDVYFSARKAAAAGGVGGAWIDIDVKDLKLANNAQYQISVYPVLDWNADKYPSAPDPDNPDRVKPEDVEESIKMITEEGEAWNAAHANDGRSKRYSWSCKFWIDSDAPFISDTQIRVDRDRSGEATYYLDLYLTDNHYVCSMGLYAYSKDDGRFMSAIGDGLRPIDSDRNTTTLVSYNITNMWEQINEGLLLRMADPAQSNKDATGRNYTEFQVILYDYALNASWYTIDLMDLLKADVHTAIKIGKTGNYRTYSASGRDSVEVLTSTNREIAKDENGNYLTIDSLTLVPGQKVNLKNAIISEPDTAWRDELEFTVSQGDIIRFDDETYELYAVRQPDAEPGKTFQRGHAQLTITSRINKNVQKVLDVYVLTNEEVKAYNINVGSLQEKNELTGMTFKDGSYRAFNAGESYIVEAEPEPWFIDFDPENYFISWRSSMDLMATVEPLKETDPEYKEDPTKAPLKARVVANAMTRDENGNYVTYDADGNPVPAKYEKNLAGDFLITATIYKKISADEYVKTNPNHYYDEATKTYGEKVGTNGIFSGNVRQEFVVSGNTLTEYHGAGGHVVIPDNLSITTIGDMVFMNRNDIISITFPEGVETINRAACAYMKKLEMIKLPSTIQTIGEYAFCASYNLDDAGPETRLMIVDTSACVSKPWKASRNAFAMQRYIGVDLDNSTITDIEDSLEPSAKVENEIKLLDESKMKLFNTSMLRLAADYSFYGMRFVTGLDFSGLKAAGIAAFYEYGAAFSKYDDIGTCTATFGPNTMAGLAAFVGHGIKKLVLPMRHINEQMFFGSTVIRLVDNGTQGQTQQVDAIYGALEEIEFTADDLVIEDAAFVYSTVEKIEFKGSVESIGEAAFYGCRKLTTVTFQEECKEIGVQAFADTAITEFTLPDGLEKLGGGAFANCEKLTTVKIAEGCTLNPSSFSATEEIMVVESAPFMGCKKLTKFTLEDGKDEGEVNDYLTLKNGAIYAEEGKKLVCVPAGYSGKAQELLNDGVETIGAYAFGGMQFGTYSKDVNLSSTSVKKIENGAFAFSSVGKVTLNDKITEIGDAAFLGSTISEINFGNSSKLTKIGNYAFYGPETGGKLTSVTLPASLTELGELAFAYQYQIKSITFKGNGVKEIKTATFFANASLTEISMADESGKVQKNTLYVKSIGLQAFVNTHLTELNLPNLESIDEEAFYASNYLTKITMPNVKYIGKGAFRIFEGGNPVSSLSDIILSENGNAPKLEEIGEEAFMDLPKLTSIDLSSVKKIGDRAFMNSTLETVKSLDKVEEIGEFAFANSKVNKTNDGDSFKLPATLTKVGMGAFAGTDIKAFDITTGSSYFVNGGSLYRKALNGKNEFVAYPSGSDATEYTIFDDTVRVNAYSFAYTKNLKTINIPGSVTNIGDGAFYGASVSEYKFGGLAAPELETSQEGFVTDYRDAFWWQLYRNFKGYFSYNMEGESYKYNSVRQRDENDILDDMQDADGNPIDVEVNTSYTGGGLTNTKFGITLYYPSNAKGFDTFVWKNYFDEAVKTAEVRDTAVDEVEKMIKELPEPSKVTVADRAAIINARAAYDRLASDAQRAFVDPTLLKKLTDCEAALDTLSAVIEVMNMIDALPDIQSLIDKENFEEADRVALENKNAVEAARKAYNALSADQKNMISAERLAKLEAYENRLSEQNGGKNGCGCSSCGTIAFGSGNGGSGLGGLMIGLVLVLGAAVALVLLPKRRRNIK